MENLKTMLKLNLIQDLSCLTKFCEGEVCEGCQFEKAHQFPFDKSSLWCQAPLELIHDDVMEPTTTPFSGYL